MKFESELKRKVLNGDVDFSDMGEVNASFSENLVLFNYTPECGFKYPQEWNSFEMCSRGLILNRNTGEFVARPFPKFWNWGQGDHWTDSEIKRVYEKVDGSLGISYINPSDGRICFSTRGSFHSEQAEWATDLWNQEFFDVEIPEHWTLLVEIIYPENQIVIDYCGWKGLVVLAARNKHTGEKIDFEDVVSWFRKEELWNNIYIRLVEVLDFPDIDTIIDFCDKQENLNEEGFVVEFEDEKMFKFKGKAYAVAHKLVSDISYKRIHEMMLEGTDISQVRGAMPDEFINDFDSIHTHIKDYIHTLHISVLKTYGVIIEDLPEDYTQKDFALMVKERLEILQPHLFAFHKHQDENRLKETIKEKALKMMEKENEI